VREQIQIAAGEPLSVTQQDIQLRGHAVECRINAENPDTFMPSPGQITQYHQPGGPGIRVDSHIFNNYRVPPYYDSLIAKVIAYGETREQALARMSGALREMVVDGIDTNIRLQQRLVNDAAFRRHALDIHYLERQLSN
jgi:acetyl-CoA carboxylase biotin carboxylase subunit